MLWSIRKPRWMEDRQASDSSQEMPRQSQPGYAHQTLYESQEVRGASIHPLLKEHAFWLLLYLILRLHYSRQSDARQGIKIGKYRHASHPLLTNIPTCYPLLCSLPYSFLWVSLEYYGYHLFTIGTAELYLPIIGFRNENLLQGHGPYHLNSNSRPISPRLYGRASWLLTILSFYQQVGIRPDNHTLTFIPAPQTMEGVLYLHPGTTLVGKLATTFVPHTLFPQEPASTFLSIPIA